MKKSRLNFGAAVISAIPALVPEAHAVTVDAGDYVYVPDRTGLSLLYLQHFEAKGLYVKGKRVSNDASLSGDVGIFRMAEYFDIFDHHSITLEFIQPFGKFNTGGSLSGVGVTNGIGDLILAAPVHFVRDPTGREQFSISPYLWLPTGNYDRNNAINPLGENRWKWALQFGSTNKVSEKVSLEFVGDVRWHGKNSDFGPAGGSMQQKPLFEFQTHVRYLFTPGTFLAGMVSHIWAGETRVNGIDQADQQSQTKTLITVGHMILPDFQILASVGKDLSVRTGLKEEGRFNIRFLKLF